MYIFANRFSSLFDINFRLTEQFRIVLNYSAMTIFYCDLYR